MGILDLHSYSTCFQGRPKTRNAPKTTFKGPKLQSKGLLLQVLLRRNAPDPGVCLKGERISYPSVCLSILFLLSIFLCFCLSVFLSFPRCLDLSLSFSIFIYLSVYLSKSQVLSRSLLSPSLASTLGSSGPQSFGFGTKWGGWMDGWTWVLVSGCGRATDQNEPCWVKYSVRS